LQDPNAPEPLQVYGYAPEIEQLTLPTLVFIGDEEQYQRRRVIETSIKVMQDKGRDPVLVAASIFVPKACGLLPTIWQRKIRFNARQNLCANN
jgi:hypothetical protein